MALSRARVGYIIKQRAAKSVACDVGDNRDAVESLFGKLGFDVERTYRVDFVAEEVDAVRQLVGVAEDVEYRAAHGEVAGFIDIIYLGEPVVAQPFLRLCQVNNAADADTEGVVGDGLARGGALGKRLGICDDEAQVAVVGDAAESLGAQNLRGRVDLTVFDVAFIARREYRDGLLADEAREVEIEISGIVGRIADDEHGHRPAFHAGEHHGGRRAGQRISRHLGATPCRRESLCPGLGDKCFA